MKKLWFVIIFILLTSDLLGADIFAFEKSAYVSSTTSDVWGQVYVKKAEAWQVLGTRKHRTVVAVLDTGIDVSHFRLAANMWTNPGEIPNNNKDDDNNGYVDDYYGYNFVSETSGCTDDYGHGTMVAGIIAATKDTENETDGFSGICPDALLMAVKVLDEQGLGEIEDIIQGIYYAVNNGAEVINISLGTAKPNLDFERALGYAYEHGVVVVVAAGNEATNVPAYPAYSKYVVTVGALNTQGLLADFSNYGDYLDILAPGVDIYSTYPQYFDIKGFNRDSGTSFAAPFVAGVAALLKSYNPDLKNYEITGYILRGTDKSEELVYGNRDRYGYGILDAEKAAKLAVSTPADPAEIYLKVYPNPFIWSKHKAVKIEGIPFDETVKIFIYDITGRIVRTLDDPYSDVDLNAGTAIWNGKNDYGEVVGSGIYYIKIDSSKRSEVKKVTFIR